MRRGDVYWADLRPRSGTDQREAGSEAALRDAVGVAGWRLELPAEDLGGVGSGQIDGRENSGFHLAQVLGVQMPDPSRELRPVDGRDLMTEHRALL